MPILNYQNIPVLHTWHGIEPRITFWNSPHWLAELHHEEINSWCIGIFTCTAFDIYHINGLIPDDILKSIKAGSTKLIIENSGHGYHDIPKHLIENLILLCNIPPQSIILRSESADMLAAVQFWCEQYNTPVFKVQWTVCFAAQYSSESKGLTNTDISKHDHKQLHYLSFNGLARPHRLALVLLLQHKGLIGKGLLSYNVVEPVYSADDSFKCLYDWFGNNNEFFQILEKNKDFITNLKPMYLDVGAGAPVNGDFLTTYRATADFYKRTRFSIVTETSFPSPKKYKQTEEAMILDAGRILSEKIFKPIVHKHPFLLITNPNVLPLLQYLGYKTFHPWINEDYDQEFDDAKRLLMIANEIERLSQLEDDDLAEWSKATAQIAEYNFKVLQDSNIWSYDLPLCMT
jgi:hypothetical protein